MELKIFRDTLPQAGTSCTVKAELPLETEILISDYLPPGWSRFRTDCCFYASRWGIDETRRLRMFPCCYVPDA